MWSLPRGTRAAARSLQPVRTILQPRRNASHEAPLSADARAKAEAELKAIIERSSAQDSAEFKEKAQAEFKAMMERSSGHQNAGHSHAQDHSQGAHGHGESALHLKDANPSGSESMGVRLSKSFWEAGERNAANSRIVRLLHDPRSSTFILHRIQPCVRIGGQHLRSILPELQRRRTRLGG